MPATPPVEKKSEIEELRRRIDALDRELVALLARRQAIAGRIVRLKTGQGQRRRAPQREEQILAARAAQAEELGVSPTLIGDLMKRIFRESYGPDGGSEGD